MVNRTQRKIFYGAGYLLLFTLFGVLVYSATRQEPSCFDGVQNQEEEGIDCGGPCDEDCALRFLEAPRITDTKFVVVDGFIVVVGELYNPNEAYGARLIDYTISVSSADGRVRYSTSGTTFLYGGERKLIIEAIPEANVGVFERVEITIENPLWERIGAFSEPRLTLLVESVVYNESEGGLRIHGRIRNEEARRASVVNIAAVLYDKNGRLAGASKTEIALEEFEEKEFVILHPFVDDINTELTAISYEARR